MNGFPTAATLLTGLSILSVAYYVFYVVGYWKAFVKAGEPGWKTLIPFYNQYTMFKLAWKPSAFWLYLVLQLAGGALQSMMETNTSTWLSLAVTVISIAVFVYYVMFNLKTAKAYGKSAGFGVGLIVLPYIFMIILGWGNSVYVGNPDRTE